MEAIAWGSQVVEASYFASTSSLGKRDSTSFEDRFNGSLEPESHRAREDGLIIGTTSDERELWKPIK